MNKVKKIVVGVLLTVSVAFCLTGCSEKLYADFTVNDSEITVSYDIGGGYDFFYDDTYFYVGNRGTTPAISGTFASEESFDFYTYAVEVDEKCSLLGISEVFNNEFITFSQEDESGDSVFVHIFRIHDTNLFAVLMSHDGEEDLLAQKDFITFDVE